MVQALNKIKLLNYQQNSYFQCRILPKLISKHTDVFKYINCKFWDKVHKEKTGFINILGRKHIEQICNLVNCFTIETSFGVYINKEN